MNTHQKRLNIVNEHGELIGYLDPLTEITDDFAATLARWRNNAREFFFDQREVTAEGTKAWAQGMIYKTDRTLFIIRLPDLTPIGTYAYYIHPNNVAELGNLIKGEKLGDRRLIFYAEVKFLEWLFAIGMKKIFAKVFSDNERILKIHRELGFVASGESVMVKSIDGYVPVDYPENFHKYDPSNYDAQMVIVELTFDFFYPNWYKAQPK